jgi:hypothetical protein
MFATLPWAVHAFSKLKAMWCAGAMGLVVAAISPARARAQDNALTQEELAQGWSLLFDGKTTAGWEIQGDAAVADGVLVLGGNKVTRARAMPLLGRKFELRLEYRTERPGMPINVRWDTGGLLGSSSSSRSLDRQSKNAEEWIEIIYTGDVDPKTGIRSVNARFRALGEAAFVAQNVTGTNAQGGTSVSFDVPPGTKLYLRNVKLTTDAERVPAVYFLAAGAGILLIVLLAFVLFRARRKKRIMAS